MKYVNQYNKDTKYYIRVLVPIWNEIARAYVT